MPKFAMPSPAEFNNFFLSKKVMYEPKKDPVWVYLEKEMQANLHKKPYNKKVHDWLIFLRDMKRYFHHERKKEERILKRDGGPKWYVEMSGNQKNVLKKLTVEMHYDLIEERPTRTRLCLSDLGITRSVSSKLLLKIIQESGGDTAVFIWKLYTAIYKTAPNELRGEYDMDAMLLMSALVFIDLDEIIQNMSELTKPASEKPANPQKKKKKSRYYEPKCRYGAYLQKMYIPLYCRHPSPQRGQRMEKLPPRMEKSITLRSKDSYERLRMDISFIEKRMKRCQQATQSERICNYKFWEAPAYLFARDKKMVDYFKKLKLLGKKATMNHMTAFENQQFNVGPVVFVGGHPRYLLNDMAVIPTGYIPIHGGTLRFHTGEYLRVLEGFIKFPRDKIETCDIVCNCMDRWESKAMEYLGASKCTCNHRYDYYLEGKSRGKYFYPPTKNLPLWFDEAKVFQLDSVEDFIKETVRLAEMSQDPTPTPSHQELSAGGIKTRVLLESFLADLSDTPLVIPHLPQASYLNNLLEWVRKRFKGKIHPDGHRQYLLQSLRRWLWLKHMDFRKRAYKIPFTSDEVDNMTWAHRRNIQYLFETLLKDFTTRNRMSQLHQTRLWWSTMKYNQYPNDAFLDVFFTYLPGRMKDTHVVNPFNSELCPRNVSRPCPLNF